MTKKKICVLTTKSITIKGFLINQLDFLSQNGFEVTVVCDKDIDFFNELPSTIEYRPITMKRGVDGFGMFKSIRDLYRLFKLEKFDIVQYSTPNAAFYTSIASWLAKIPVRLYCQWGIRYVGFSGWKRLLFKGFEKVTCYLSTDIEPDSNGNLEFCRNEKLYPSHKSRVIWNGSANGVDLTKFNINMKNQWQLQIRSMFNIQDNDFVFGFIGRINRDKGVNELLYAFKEIYKTYPSNVKLLIVGPEENNKEIDQDIYEWSKKCGAVIYSGFTTEVEKYYAAMDVFILPSYREGFGTVVIEAEAMGIPVVVTDIPGPTNAMQDGVTGFVVPKGEVDPLVQKMDRLLNDLDLCKKLGINAFEFARDKFEQKELWGHVLIDRNQLIWKSRLVTTGVYKRDVQR